ncbi:MAG: hypothetical protein HGB22_06390 [Chlorobiaceae bacterium]|nr:hypothetical protein [Chlorobiaceae bacterium]
MAINAKTLKKKPIANQPTAWLPTYPFFIEIIKHASPHMTLMTSMNIQLDKSIMAMEHNVLMGLQMIRCHNLKKQPKIHKQTHPLARPIFRPGGSEKLLIARLFIAA